MKKKSEARLPDGQARRQKPEGDVPVSPERPVVTRVEELPPGLATLVEKMLVEGATFEDTVEAIEECGQARVTLHAVQNFFRGSLPLQQRRIQRQKETAQALKKALGDPKSGEQEMADAILMTGLMRVNRGSSAFSTKDALSDKYERESMRLKKKETKIKEQKLRLDKEELRVKIEGMETNRQLAAARLLELQGSLESKQEGNQLSAETLRKIREIYGLIGDQTNAQG